MTAVQISVSRGANLVKITDFTIGTNAPGTGDIELRYNLTDTNGGLLTRKDIILALDGMIRALSSGPTILTSPVL
jgi:hypothetical protein